MNTLKKIGNLVSIVFFCSLLFSCNSGNNSGNNSESKSANNINLEKFIGTYRLDYYENDGTLWNCPLIIVLEDGRLIHVSETLGGDKVVEHIGNIVPISENAFRIKAVCEHFYAHTFFYSTANNTTFKGMKKFHNAREAVFDIKENRLYSYIDEYNNRDIADAEYIKFKHTSSTKY